MNNDANLHVFSELEALGLSKCSLLQQQPFLTSSFAICADTKQEAQIFLILRRLVSLLRMHHKMLCFSFYQYCLVQKKTRLYFVQTLKLLLGSCRISL